MSWPTLEQLVKTRAVYSMRHMLANQWSAADILHAFRRKFPHIHHQTVYGLMNRVQRAMASAEAMAALPPNEPLKRSHMVRFTDWVSRERGWESTQFHYHVVAELRTPYGRRSHYRTIDVSGEQPLTRDEIMRIVQQAIIHGESQRDLASPPAGRRFGRIVGIEIKMAWRS